MLWLWKGYLETINLHFPSPWIQKMGFWNNNTLYMQQLDCFIHFLSLLSLFGKKKEAHVVLWDHLAVCMCIPPPPNNFWIPESIFTKPDIYHGMWAHINGVLHNSIPSVIPTLILLECLNQSLWNLVHTSCYLRPSQWHTAASPVLQPSSPSQGAPCSNKALAKLL
jgi:hypothetical protein